MGLVIDGEEQVDARIGWIKETMKSHIFCKCQLFMNEDER
jgi:hypothetical protein